MEWSLDAWLEGLQQQSSEQRNIDLHKAPYRLRKPQLIGTLKKALGKLPSDDQPLVPQLLERKEYEDFTMERLTYTTMEHVQVPVIVLIPKGQYGESSDEQNLEAIEQQNKKQAWPAVLACHGHGSGQHEAIGMDQDGQWLENCGIHNQFAVHLVRMGLLVVIPEIMGFGVRRITRDLQDSTLRNSCASLSAQLLMHGRTLAGMRVYEARRAIDYILSRPDVNPKQIGIFGLSGGALIAAYTAALDDRIRAAVISGWASTYAGSIMSIRHCIDNYLPGILLEAEQPELMGLLAPRPLFIEAGKKDHIFPIEHTQKAITFLQSIYEEFNQSEQFTAHIHDGGHEINGEQSFQWLADKLQRA